MEDILYLNNSYVKGWGAEVVDVKEKYIILDKTAFFPNGGGQPFDTGVIERINDNEKFNVVYTGKFGEKVSHEVNKTGLKVGDKVKCRVDWSRRYKHMKMHTAIHILSEVLFRETCALITGNQIGEERSRIDFSLKNYNREEIFRYVEEANKIIDKDLKVKIEFLPRQEALKIPQVSKLAKGLLENLEIVRIVLIGDFNSEDENSSLIELLDLQKVFDVQADGGTHVSSTKEIGRIKLLKIDNRGKNNRRIYLKLE